MRTVATTDATRDGILRERADRRAYLARQLANEKAKLKPAEAGLKEHTKVADKLRPRVATLQKWADAGDAEAKLALQRERERLSEAEGQCQSWQNGIRGINDRIVAFTKAIEEHDAQKIDDLAQAELDSVLSEIRAERGEAEEGAQRQRVDAGQMFQEQAADAERRHAARAV